MSLEHKRNFQKNQKVTETERSFWYAKSGGIKTKLALFIAVCLLVSLVNFIKSSLHYHHFNICDFWAIFRVFDFFENSSKSLKIFVISLLSLHHLSIFLLLFMIHGEIFVITTRRLHGEL